MSFPVGKVMRIRKRTKMGTEAHQPLKPGIIFLMALGCGVDVADNYYHQPLLPQMAHGVHVPEEWIAYLPALNQAGFALGLLLFVPLGDLFERRRLVVLSLGAAAIMLVMVAVAPTFSMLAAAIFTLGLLGVGVQLLIPFAAHLAPPAERGRVVGTVMGGMLCGVLLSRTISGIVGDSLGWRVMYWIAAVATFGVLLVLWAVLPKSQPSARLPYTALLRSMVVLVREEPTLRESCLFGAATFGAFSAFWANLAFHLSGPPFNYGSVVAGLFGLIGVVGVVAAPLVGRAGDRLNARRMIGVGIVITILSFMLFGLGGRQLWVLMGGLVLMDLGVQIVHVSNQTRNQALRSDARNRLNTVYMFSYFVGGVVGSSLGAAAWAAVGWAGVCVVGIILPTLALGVFVFNAPARPKSDVTETEGRAVTGT
jgi:predicted MFS family arabinose efflux permease